MANVMQVHPNLMGAAAVQLTFHQADSVAGNQHAIICSGGASMLWGD